MIKIYYIFPSVAAVVADREGFVPKTVMIETHHSVTGFGNSRKLLPKLEIIEN